MVQQVAGGHNCWLASNPGLRRHLTTWISNWAGGASGSSRGTQIQLTAPPERRSARPRCSRPIRRCSATTVYPVVTAWCSRCHSDTAATPQSPYFASGNVATAYAAAQPEIDLNTPTNSTFYIRLAQQSHNCWGNPVNCPASAATMLAAIQAFANGITVTPVDPTLIVSKALSLTQGTVASGAGRYDAHDIAKWQFQEGSGTDRLRHQRRRSGDGPDVSGQRQLGRRLGHQLQHRRPAPRRAPRPAPSCTAADQRQRPVQHRAVGRTRPTSPRPRPTSRLLRRRYHAQLHARSRTPSNTRPSAAAAPPASTARPLLTNANDADSAAGAGRAAARRAHL